MTVSTLNTYDQFIPDGIDFAFGFTFHCDDETWVYALLDNVELAGGVVVLNADQSASPGGTITFGAPPVGSLLIIGRATSLDQATQYNPYGRFPASSHESAMDKLTQAVQDFADVASRTAQYPIGTLPAEQVQQFPLYEADRVWAWHSTTPGVVVNIVNPAVAAAASAAAALVSETNADASEAAAATSATNAATSATNAAASETAAAASETAAAASETAAAASATSAATSYDNFDDRYLGPKAAEPALDNDGNALLVGAMFFLTTTNIMKVYDGAVWSDVGTPIGVAGLDTEVQFNDGGNLAADAGMTYNKTTDTLTLAGTVVVGAAPTAALQVATKGYVDGIDAAIQTELDTKANLSGAAFTGAISTSVGNISATAGDLVSYRNGAATTGIVWLGNTNSRYIYFDGTNYQMPTSNLYIAGSLAIRQGAGTVDRATLKTTTAAGSLAIASGAEATYTLTGGTYSWWTASVVPNAGLSNVAFGGNSNTAAGVIGLVNPTVEACTFYVDERYVQASPPYNDGPHFAFLTVDALGNIVHSSFANDPPWAYHGPTDITPSLYIDGKPYSRQKKINGIPYHVAMKDPLIIKQIIDGVAVITEELVEVTLNFKDSNKGVIPHPFNPSILPGHTVIRLEPGTQLMSVLADMCDSGNATEVRKIVVDKYITFDNTSINMDGAVGVYRARWKLTP